MITCPCCDGDSTFLGALGSRNHFRCRDCGIDFSATESELKATLEAYAASHDVETCCFHPDPE